MNKNGKTQTIPIEGAAEDLNNNTKNSEHAAQNGGRRRNVVNGDYNNNNFNGEVVNNFDGVALGSIFRGQKAIEKSDNARGSIICDEAWSASNDDDCENSVTGRHNTNNFDGSAVYNYPRKPQGKCKN